jgi:hypothetical protein
MAQGDVWRIHWTHARIAMSGTFTERNALGAPFTNPFTAANLISLIKNPECLQLC